MRRHRTAARGFLLVAALAGILTANAHAAVPNLLAFPVVANVRYSDDFGAPRPGGPHPGIDILAPWRAKVVAAEKGRVELHVGSRIGTCMLYLNGRSGTQYVYIHLNNDLTRRSEDSGGCKRGVAYAPGLRTGDVVRRGELVGYVGDSGDAENGAYHLHFEIRPGGRSAIDPYRHLRRAKHILFPRPATLDDLSLRVRGTVTALGDGTLTMRTRWVRMSNDWRVTHTRSLTVGVPADVTVRRVTDSGLTTMSFSALSADSVVTIRTPAFAPLWPYVLARRGTLQAPSIAVRG